MKKSSKIIENVYIMSKSYENTRARARARYMDHIMRSKKSYDGPKGCHKRFKSSKINEIHEKTMKINEQLEKTSKNH